MLERLSNSVDGARQRTARAVGDRLHVFGGRKQVPFHIVISELRAELMNTKHHSPGHPCVLLWVRGDTVHVTEDSVGRTVLSWSETYFAQVVSLQAAGSGSFRPKECKFKVQQRGKTIAKTALLDLAKYCSDIGLAREQSVSLPLQPSGTLYFVISTAPASEQQRLQHQPSSQDPPSSQSSARNLTRASFTPSLGGGGCGGGAAAATSGIAAAVPEALDSVLSPSHSVDSISRHLQDGSQYGSVVAKYGSAVAGAAATASSALAAATKADEGERPSAFGWGHQRKTSGGPSAAWVAGLAATSSGAKASSSSPPPLDPTTDGGGGEREEKSHLGLGVFKRKAGGSNTIKSVFAGASGAFPTPLAATASASAVGGHHVGPPPTLNSYLTLRKSDSDNIIAGAASGIDLRASWDAQAERSLSQAALVGGGGGGGPQTRGGSGSGYLAAGHRAIHSFTNSTSAAADGRSPGPLSSPLFFKLPAAALDGAGRNLTRRSGAASSCSDTAATAAKGGGGAAALAAAAGGGGWGTWLRSGLGWGRPSNQSATGMSTGTHSQTSLPNAPGGGGGEHGEASSALEATIRDATEATELRELAIDLLHERDEWRARALAAQDALGRAQTSRGSAVREAQRLEVRLRQYQDELGRRTDGSLLQELVEAKVRIAELANENMKLRRQITHMGPLFYDDSGDDVAPDPRS